ncbi:hypothetical protein [Neorhizobium sp. LjRoot104]|uniref:hypothetical protein n=1 Tax=Neorhizobium sp. LjRoot104 TaxID=3342254 RepID=UPI003ECD251B
MDDDSLVLMNTVLMVEALGHTVIEASSGDEALRILEQQAATRSPDHRSCHAPHDRAELARRLAERHPKLHVILATGYAELLGGEGAGLARLSNYLVRISSTIHLPWSVRQTDSTSSVKALREMASAG